MRLHRPTDLTWASRDGARVQLEEGERLRFEAVLPYVQTSSAWIRDGALIQARVCRLPEDPSATITVLVSLPPSYPDSEHPPQLQLLNRYLGEFGVDSGLCESLPCICSGDILLISFV